MPLLLKLIASIVVWVSVIAAALFVPAGTMNWWRAWLIVGILVVGSLAAVAGLFPTHRELIEERLRLPVQKGQPLADKIVLTVFFVTFYGLLAFAALDVFHFRLMKAPGPVVSSLGLVLFVGGWAIGFLALRENAFAATVVKHSDRQTVVDTGPYGIVRHPLYAGGIPMLIGLPLWLESYPGALAALVPVVVIALRALLEERFLRQELQGYEAYTRRVRYRLVPFLW